MSFKNLNIIDPINKALIEEGYTKPTPIQMQAIPAILNRKDILGSAQTGTGKTAAFAVPILQLLHNGNESGQQKKKIKTLILSPTRELASQINDSMKSYGKYTALRSVTVFGGVPQRRQTDKLRKGTDILIATPGRLLDLMNQNYINLDHVQIFVLDEADRMLDMGFINDIKKIISRLPAERQTLFFSATMPKEILNLSGSILRNPEKIIISSEKPVLKIIKQGVYHVAKQNKNDLLLHLLKSEDIDSALVFTRTKHGADKVTKFLNKSKVFAEAIHGNKSQHARQNALNNFKSKKTRVLVATDIASRGIDVEGLSHVINYEMPEDSETYVHRIGRTGRAGLSGTALSFCEPGERGSLKGINKFIVSSIPVIEDHPFSMNSSQETDERGAEKKFELRPAGKKKNSGSFRAGKNKKRDFDKNRFKRKNRMRGKSKKSVKE